MVKVVAIVRVHKWIIFSFFFGIWTKPINKLTYVVRLTDVVHYFNEKTLM